MPMSRRKILALAFLAIVAFSSNSILCRLALKQSHIDAGTFTAIRLTSAAFVLFFFAKVRTFNSGSWKSALALFVYAASFSFSYTAISAGTGALLLYAAVQFTMISWGIRSGDRFTPLQVLGMCIALSGFLIIELHAFSKPSYGYAAMMIVAGVAWGIYSIIGKGSKNPLLDTAGNFAKATPFALMLLPVSFRHSHYDVAGIVYGCLSGAVTSGLGYVAWYSVLRHLQSSSAAIIQLAVPVLVAMAGLGLLNESLSKSLVISSFLILGGLYLVLKGVGTINRDHAKSPLTSES
jgi:drug/metabolite transporter (DMT)-like permease